MSNHTANKRINAWTNKAWLGSCLTNFSQALLARYARRYTNSRNGVLNEG